MLCINFQRKDSAQVAVWNQLHQRTRTQFRDSTLWLLELGSPWRKLSRPRTNCVEYLDPLASWIEEYELSCSVGVLCLCTLIGMASNALSVRLLGLQNRYTIQLDVLSRLVFHQWWLKGMACFIKVVFDIVKQSTDHGGDREPKHIHPNRSMCFNFSLFFRLRLFAFTRKSKNLVLYSTVAAKPTVWLKIVG